VKSEEGFLNLVRGSILSYRLLSVLELVPSYSGMALFILFLWGLVAPANLVQYFFIYRLPVNWLTFGFKLFDYRLHHLSLDIFLSRYAFFSFAESTPIFVNSHYKSPMLVLHCFHFAPRLSAGFPPFDSRPIFSKKLFLFAAMRFIGMAYLGGPYFPALVIGHSFKRAASFAL